MRETELIVETAVTIETVQPEPRLHGGGEWLRALIPGLALATGVAVLAWYGAAAEERLFHYALLEPLVLALLLGMVIRLAWTPPTVSERGIGFAGKELLEFAIILLGASLDLRTIAHAGPKLAGAVLLSVSTAIVVGTFLGRRAGLTPKLAILVAVGNAVCGNSAIAAVAPTIRAKKQEVASAIALTAVLGVGVVLLLPLLIPLVGQSHYQYGVLAGLTVYAVPQVLAATFPVSAESGQIGTRVKLTRVLLLGPVVAIFAFLHRHEQEPGARFSLNRFLPWFVIGFALCAMARTAGALSPGIGNQAQNASKILTIVAMAGLGLSVDIRAVREAGHRVAAVVVGLLIILVALALGIIALLHLNG